MSSWKVRVAKEKNTLHRQNLGNPEAENMISFYGQGAPGTNQKFQQNFWPVQSMMRLRSQDCNSKGHEV